MGFLLTGMLPDIARFCPFFGVTVTKTVTIGRLQRVMWSGMVMALVTATIADWFIEPHSPCPGNGKWCEIRTFWFARQNEG